MIHLLLLLPLISLKTDVRWKRLSKTKDLLIHYSNSLLLNTSLILMKAFVESKVFCCSEIVSKVSEVLLWFSFTTSYSSHLWFYPSFESCIDDLYVYYFCYTCFHFLFVHTPVEIFLLFDINQGFNQLIIDESSFCDKLNTLVCCTWHFFEWTKLL